MGSAERVRVCNQYIEAAHDLPVKILAPAEPRSIFDLIVA